MCQASFPHTAPMKIYYSWIDYHLLKLIFSTTKLFQHSNLHYTGQQQICCLGFFRWFRTNLMRWIQKSHWFCSIRSSFFNHGHMFLTFLFTCTHMWRILEVGGGKMPCWIIVLIGNDYFNDKKNSGPIILGDYVEKGKIWNHKTSKSSKNLHGKA